MGAYLPRTLGPTLTRLGAGFPVLFLTGPRQSGKTTLARATFPGWPYFNLEDLQLRDEVREDPRAFLGRLEGQDGVVLDEVQRVPELFSWLQPFVDDRRVGTVLLSGSQNFLVSEHITQSLAGRAAVLELLPFSQAELARRDAVHPDAVPGAWDEVRAPPPLALTEALLAGGYPAIHDRGLEPAQWLDGYLRTYVERDVRALSNIGDLATFSRFLRLCAGRTANLLNLASLAGDAGISRDTARRWLSVLEASYVVRTLPPHFENFSKRLTKSPKLYFLDAGFACHLLGIRTAAHLESHPLRGALFETMTFSELVKLCAHHGRRPDVYFWRESNGHEVDFLLDAGPERIALEAKAGITVPSDAFSGLDYYERLRGGTRGVLVHGGTAHQTRRGHRVLPWWGLT